MSSYHELKQAAKAIIGHVDPVDIPDEIAITIRIRRVGDHYNWEFCDDHGNHFAVFLDNERRMDKEHIQRIQNDVARFRAAKDTARAEEDDDDYETAHNADWAFE